MERVDDAQRHSPESARSVSAQTVSARPRSAARWVVLGLVGGTCLTLAVLLTSGLSFADEAGQPFGAPAVSITPTASVTGSPSSTPGATPTHTPTSGPPVVVGAPPPVTVNLDDDEHGDHSEKGTNGSDSGSAGSSGAGSGSGSAGNAGTGGAGNGNAGSGGAGSGTGSSGKSKG